MSIWIELEEATTVRKILIALFTAGVVFLAPQTAFSAPSPFTGAWEGIDVDGSQMTLTVSGGSSQVRIAFFDDHACSGHPDDDAEGPATIRGTGTIDGATLTWSFDEIRCANGIVISTPGATNTFTYDATTDTLSVDPELWGGEVTWSRVGG